MTSIKIGSAGWQYKDWQGVVYPTRRPKGFSALRYVADFVDMVEVNSSFYGLPKVATVKSWIDSVAHKPDFEFSVKLLQRFTHASMPYSAEDVKAFSKILNLLQSDDRLAALLVQFPFRFKYMPENVEYVLKLAADFQDFPVAVEFRHSSWLNESIRQRLREQRISFVNIDEPEHPHSLPSTSWVTGNFAYLRLHGRNAAAWFDEQSDVTQRYNYLYNTFELDSIAGRINTIREKAEQMFIIFNNHYRGQALVNLLQTKARLQQEPTRVPVQLLRAYPELRSIGRVENEQLGLF